MEITNSLIEKFFARECTQAEFEAVISYFEANPDLAAQYMGLEGWTAAEPSAAAAVGHQEEVLQALKQRLFPVKARVRVMRWAAVAAAVLVVAGGWIVLSRSGAKDDIAALTGGAEAERPVKKAIWTYRNNASGKTENIVLPDGSAVKLYAHSTIRYTDSFGVSRRDSWLEGSAEFTVKKDKVHPFTVYGSSLATTALGTVFAVSTKAGDETVKLYSGRVVVRSVQGLKGWDKDVYLAAGEQVAYDHRRLLARISPFGTDAPKEAETNAAGQDLVFNNSSLKEVFQQLSIQYHTKFNYRSRDLSGLNFTGSVARTDSLNIFLRLLAGMNNLDIREQGSGYIVSRHKE